MAQASPVSLQEQFGQVFREEHRVVRDTLLEILSAFSARNTAKARELLRTAAAYVGPHFRYEEESLYPVLSGIFGQEYVEKLFGDHDRAIGAAKRLLELSGRGSLSDTEAAEAVRLVRGILPHVSDCDGLSIYVERVADSEVRRIFEARERAKKEGYDLLTWADTVRQRPYVRPT